MSHHHRNMHQGPYNGPYSYHYGYNPENQYANQYANQYGNQYSNYQGQGQFYVPNANMMDGNYVPVNQFQPPEMVYHYGNQPYHFSNSNRGRSRGYNMQRGNYHNYRGQRSGSAPVQRKFDEAQGSTEFEIELENKMDEYIEKTDSEEKSALSENKEKSDRKSSGEKGNEESNRGKKEQKSSSARTFTNSSYRGGKRSGREDDSRYSERRGENSTYQGKNYTRGGMDYRKEPRGGARPKSATASYSRGEFRNKRNADSTLTDRYSNSEDKENGEYYNTDREYVEGKKNMYSRKADFEEKRSGGRKMYDQRPGGGARSFDNNKQHQKSGSAEGKPEQDAKVTTKELSTSMVSLKKQDTRNERKRESERRENDRRNQPARGHRRPPVLRTVSGKIDESQRGVLIEQLTMGTYECMVCCETVRGQNAVWNCGNCYHVFHLRCIKQWAKSPAAKVEGSDSGWRCPACQNVCDKFPSQYRCFCGKIRDPEWNRMETPHSCGEVCRKPRGDNCSHPCNILCHPGPCPSCSAMVTKSCQCGQTSQTTKCSNQDVIQCDKICGKQLNCGKHFCKVKCHNGSCSPCEEIIKQKCFCERESREVTCGSKDSFTDQYSCGTVCNKVLSCGNHRCEQTCHHGNCEVCERLPSEVTRCPCRRQELSEGEKKERKSCLDPIPTCGSVCGKELPCGPRDDPHTCLQLCHEGPCAECSGTTKLRCRCGGREKEFKCIEAAQYKDEPFLCDRRCTKKRNCLRHKCGQVCCVKEEHSCDLICGKRLNCGLHKCEEPCHRGNCPPCLMAGFDEVTCHCGSEIMYPPIPCGAKPPECKKLCTRQHTCDHPVRHNCHSDESCPPCTALTTKWCMGDHEERKNIPCHQQSISCGMPCGKELPCGQHKCKKKCHSGPCQDEGETCQQPCLYKRKDCEHACGAPCHSGKPCPQIPCKAEIRIKCACGNKEAKAQCQMGGAEMSDFQRMTMHNLASSLQSGQSVDITQLTGKKATKRELECDAECAVLERNRRVALALEIQNPDLSGKLGNPTYTDFLRDYAKSNPHVVASIEKALSDLVQNAKKAKQAYRSHSFPCGNRDQRRLIHELAECYGCETQSYDFEPKKNVVATAYRDKCWLPTVTLTQFVQRELHPKAPPPIPHNYSETAIKQYAQASKQSFEVLKDRPIKASGQSSGGQTSVKEKKETNIDYFDFSRD